MITTSSDETTQALRPTARDVFAIFEDLSLFGNGERRNSYNPSYVHKTFALELIENELPNYHGLFRKVCFFSLPIQDLYASSCH
jgi:hypothetical protein